MKIVTAGLILALLLSATAQPQTLSGDERSEALVIPISYTSNHASLVMQVSINGKKACLLLDTGSMSTVIRPELAGLKRSELKAARYSQSGVGFRGDAVGKEVSFQVGNQIWPKYRVAVMDLSQVVSIYEENIDGILGLDFLQAFRQVRIDLRHQRIELTR